MNRIKLSYPVFTLTFAYLLSGNVIMNPVYLIKNPLVVYILTSAVLLVYSNIILSYFIKRKSINNTKYAKLVASALFLLVIFPMTSVVFNYTKGLGIFSDYYATAFVVIFASVACIGCSVYGAYKGKGCTVNFSYLVYPIMALWIVLGIFAFLHTKNAVPLKEGLGGIIEIDFREFLKCVGYVCFDLTLLMTVLTDNVKDSKKRSFKSSVNAAVLLYIVITGIGLVKNLLLFGEDFLQRMENPELTSISLVPLFEFPEISLIINTFACVMKMCVYACAVFFIVRDAFGKGLNFVRAALVMSLSVVALFLGIYFFKVSNQYVNIFSLIALIMCSVLNFAFFSKREEK